MNAAQNIANELASFFAEWDAKATASDIEWARGRVAAIAAKKKEFTDNATATGKRGAWDYQALFAAAGGKTWYNIFDGRNFAMIEEFMVKNSATRARNRDAKIASKLAALGEVAVTEAKVIAAGGSINGYFKVNDKIVTIQTIHAGGWNVQIAHLRVLIHVR